MDRHGLGIVPQLFELDGSWVMLVSVWDDDVLYHVVYALGDYDGHQFLPRVWGRFSYGQQLYATTTFTDTAGRRCVMSWMREQNNTPPANSDWASAIACSGCPADRDVADRGCRLARHRRRRRHPGGHLVGANSRHSDAGRNRAEIVITADEQVQVNDVEISRPQ